MSLALTPKALFRQDKDKTQAFRAIAHSTHFQHALSSALAEFAQSANPSAEQLAGVRRFISVFMNIAEEETTPTRMPVKTLNHSLLEPAK